jgi:hypothetical protein
MSVEVVAECSNPECCWFGADYEVSLGTCPECGSEVELTEDPDDDDCDE